MVHLRLNDPDTSRNKHINYITALPGYADSEAALTRLLQLAAQVRPVMQAHGFQINSLEEYEWNREFAGRNWNNGETVELILRRQDGSFAPLQWVLMVLCHELAHIKYMNHIPSQHGKLDRELRQECRQLQARKYYGDGFWSAGQRVEDNAFVAGMGMESLQGLPEYSCGGAYNSKTKPGRKRKRATGQRRGFKGPSLHTGAQTAKNFKAGRRLASDMPGQGSRVDNSDIITSAQTYKSDPSSTFRKRTQTASARELRAEAALRRLAAAKPESESEEDDFDEDGGLFVVKSEQALSTQASQETAAERRERALQYRAHEKTQGGAVRSTADEWSDFCATGQPALPHMPNQEPSSLILPRKESSTLTLLEKEPPSLVAPQSKTPSYIELLSSDDEMGTPQWACSACTLLNAPTMTSCSLCSSPRPT